MSRLKAILRDLLLALAIGLVIGLAACLLFGLLGGLIGGGFLWGGFPPRPAALLIFGARPLSAAPRLLKGGNLPEEAFRLRLKRKARQDFQPPSPLHLFRTVPRPYTTLAVGAGVLLVSLIPDLILINL